MSDVTAVTPARTSYESTPHGRRAAAARAARGAQRDRHPDAGRAARAPGGGARRRRGRGSSSSPPPTRWASPPAADVRSSSTRRARSRRMQLFADLYDAIDRLPQADRRRLPRRRASAAAPRSPVACDMRVGGANLRLRFPGAALGVPVGPARLVTLCGLAAAKYLLLELAHRRRRRGARASASSTGSPRRRAPRRRRWSWPPRSPPTRPRRSRRLKRMLHDRWDDVEEPLGGRGRGGQVEWQRSGPGLSNPLIEPRGRADAACRRSRNVAFARLLEIAPRTSA